jgi:MinD-like ATPase involved in chromosome partitioning or flagellar assembly
MSAVPWDLPEPSEPSAQAAPTHDEVILAAGPTVWEPALLAALRHPSLRLPVERRCLDAVELLAAIQTSTARVVVVSSELPRLDINVVASLRDAGAQIIGVVTHDDRHPDTQSRSEQILRAWSIDRIVAVDVTRMAGGAANIASIIRLPRAQVASVVDASPHNGDGSADASSDSAGLVVVWGSPGSVGRTSIALAVADEVAALGLDSLLVDADVDAPSIATILAVLEPGSGLPVAMRRAAAGRLDTEALRELTVSITDHLALLPGAGRPGHRSDLRSPAFAEVRRVARLMHDLVVLDLGSVPLPADGLGEQASLAALDALGDADEVIVVGGADAVGMQRLIQSLESLEDALPGRSPRVVVNAVPRSAGIEREIVGVLSARVRMPLDRLHVVSADHAAHAKALRDGLTLRESAPKSRARADHLVLVEALLGA